MAYGSVEQWFRTTYEDDFHEAFQRRGAKLRPCVRVENGVMLVNREVFPIEPPTRATVGVTALAAEYRVEIEVMAAR